ncbi:hypothetical protein B0H13DRAFT_1904308 [Mycena leptocephala]|nr:hypothetical protein B0H13DRAFT_1904308 [Mycena leptocephala]
MTEQARKFQPLYQQWLYPNYVKINSAKRHLIILNFYDYSITFTVHRQVTDPIHLRNPENYTYLVQKALSNENFSTSEKENSADAADNNFGKGKKARQKLKSRNTRDILPANVALNEKIGELRER